MKEKKELPTIQNRKARHDYNVIEVVEAGLVLSGTEVKSIRHGRANLGDSYAYVKKEEVWLSNMHISPYEQGNIFNQPPLRERKLLLHSKEISRLVGKIQEKGYTLIPLNIHWRKNKVKVDLALCKSKKLYDKRETLKKKESAREIERELSHRR